jgi:hypothetical protein
VSHSKTKSKGLLDILLGNANPILVDGQEYQAAYNQSPNYPGFAPAS